jgi:hypothetical protein
MKKCILILSVFVFKVFGQIPSPELRSKSQNSENKINHAYGTASNSIPIFNLKDGDLELPIALTYSSTGIQVEQVATRVGLGWNLSAGGEITRIVRDKPDEGFRPEYSSTFSIGINFGSIDLNWTTTQNTAYMKSSFIFNIPQSSLVYMGGWFYNGKPQYDSSKVSPNIFDHAPDIYVINVAGKTIRFTFDEYKQIQVLNGEDVKIEYFFNNYSPKYGDTNETANLSAQGFYQWKVTLSDGTQYIFGQPTAIFSGVGKTYCDVNYDLDLIGVN